jgi:hypothetical protein
MSAEVARFTAFAIIATFARGALGGADVTLAPKADRVARHSFVCNAPVEQAQRAMLAALKSIDPGSPLARRYRSVEVFGSPLFPPDDDVRQFDARTPPVSRGALDVRQWLGLPAPKRATDLWIRPDDDHYWTSDYVRGREPVPFSAEYVVHLAAQPGAAATRVDVVQLRPRVNLGKRFDLLGRAGPGWYQDIRAVEPSPLATSELTEFLASRCAPGKT